MAYIIHVEKAAQVKLSDAGDGQWGEGHLICHQCRDHDVEALEALPFPCTLEEVKEATAGEERERARSEALAEERRQRSEEYKAEKKERAAEKRKERAVARKKADKKPKAKSGGGGRRTSKSTRKRKVE
jgi:hypothetical protein